MFKLINMYTLNFEKIKQTSLDFKGKDWYAPDQIMNGIYFNIDEMPSEYFQNIPKGKYLHSPILLINEGIRDHMTQILFVLKENFTDTELGFLGWKSFSKENLINICEEHLIDICEEWPNGNIFASEFPDKINYFLESYCDRAMITSNPITIL